MVSRSGRDYLNGEIKLSNILTLYVFPKIRGIYVDDIARDTCYHILLCSSFIPIHSPNHDRIKCSDVCFIRVWVLRRYVPAKDRGMGWIWIITWFSCARWGDRMSPRLGVMLTTSISWSTLSTCCWNYLNTESHLWLPYVFSPFTECWS